MASYGDASPVTPAEVSTSSATAVSFGVPAPAPQPSASEWTRQHVRACEERYRTFVRGLLHTSNTAKQERCCTDKERRQLGLKPREIEDLPVFAHHRGAEWLFPHKHPMLMPITKSDWQEFDRRCWFLGISTSQGLEFRRASRAVGMDWP